jgi:hypothetical protein
MLSGRAQLGVEGHLHDWGALVRVVGRPVHPSCAQAPLDLVGPHRPQLLLASNTFKAYRREHWWLPHFVLYIPHTLTPPACHLFAEAFPALPAFGLREQHTTVLLYKRHGAAVRYGAGIAMIDSHCKRYSPIC